MRWTRAIEEEKEKQRARKEMEALCYEERGIPAHDAASKSRTIPANTCP